MEISHFLFLEETCMLWFIRTEEAEKAKNICEKYKRDWFISGAKQAQGFLSLILVVLPYQIQHKWLYQAVETSIKVNVCGIGIL